jgi:hypothetical protein
MCGKIVDGIANDWVWRCCETECKDTFSTKTVVVRTICIMMYEDNLENSTAFWEDTDKVKVKVKVTLEHTPKIQRGENVQLYSFFNLDARWEWMVNATFRPLNPRERPGTHGAGSSVNPRTGLDGCGKSHLFRDSIPEPPSQHRVAIPTTLSRPILWWFV